MQKAVSLEDLEKALQKLQTERKERNKRLSQLIDQCGRTVDFKGNLCVIIQYKKLNTFLSEDSSAEESSFGGLLQAYRSNITQHAKTLAFLYHKSARMDWALDTSQKILREQWVSLGVAVGDSEQKES